MAVLSLFSASGAPGVTVTSLGLALAWQRHVMLVDADASGSSSVLAGYLQGQTVHDRGLLDLAVANRVGNLSSAIATVSMPLPGSRQPSPLNHVGATDMPMHSFLRRSGWCILPCLIVKMTATIDRRVAAPGPLC